MSEDLHPLLRHQQRLVDAMEALPSPARSVWELNREGQSQDTIAASLGQPLKIVRSAWARVRDALAEVGPYRPDDPVQLSQWSPATVAQACGPAWGRFDRELSAHYTAYFEANQKWRDPKQRFSARTPEDAIPDPSLLTEIKEALHPSFCSGKSSQALALAVLGEAKREEPGLQWLWRALATDAPQAIEEAVVEHEIARDVLDERTGKPTSVDFYVETDQAVLCVEAKWGEAGLGHCSCKQRGEADPDLGECSDRVWRRAKYREHGEQVFGLPNRLDPPLPCPLSLGYQGIRNAAAALELAGAEHEAWFVLIFNDRNPYFADTDSTGAWPGWAKVLEKSVAPSAPPNFHFAAISWQELTPTLPLTEPTLDWLREKHRL